MTHAEFVTNRTLFEMQKCQDTEYVIFWFQCINREIFYITTVFQNV